MRKTIADKKITEETLLKSAMKLFLRDGFSNVSIAQIAADSELTRGAFYWHFASKDDILLKILELNRNKISNYIKAHFKIEPKNEWEFVRNLLYSRIENFWNRKDFRDYVELTWFKLEHRLSGKSIEYKVSVNDLFIENLAQTIEKGQNNGSINPLYSPLLIATYAAVILNGIYRMYYMSSHLKNKDSAINMIDSFCISLKPGT